MRNILTIGKKGKSSGDFFVSLMPNRTNFVVFLDFDNDNLLEKLKNRDLIINEVTNNSFLDTGEAEEFLKNIFEYENLTDFFDCVDLDTSLGNFKIQVKMLDENPWIKTKKIILTSDEITLKEAISAANKYPELKDNLLFLIKGNDDYISYENVLKMHNLLLNYCEVIKSCGLKSKIEQIMLAYDIVKNLVYKSFDETGEEIKIIDEAIDTKSSQYKFSLVFFELLNYLNINSKILFQVSENGKTKLSRNAIYVKDDEYDIDGIYLFDPFFDCVKGAYEKKYPVLYNYFLKTSDEVLACDQEKIPWKKIKPMEKVQGCELGNLTLDDIQALGGEKWKHIEFLYETILGRRLDFVRDILTSDEKEKKKLIENIEKFESLMHKPIKTETRLSIFDKVRRAEYYYNINSLDYNVDDMLHAMEESGWNFSLDDISLKYLTKKDKEIIGLFGGISFKMLGLRKFVSEQKIDRNVSGVKLTKSLKQYLENRENDCM